MSATTGSVVNIADPTSATRLAHVTVPGELAVAGRAGVLPGSITANTTYAQTLGHLQLIRSGASPAHFAITQFTASTGGDAGTAGGELLTYYRQSGSGTCASVVAGTTTGFVSNVVRYFYEPVGETLVINWDGPAATFPISATAGSPWCIVGTTGSGPANVLSYFGITGYGY